MFIYSFSVVIKLVFFYYLCMCIFLYAWNTKKKLCWNNIYNHCFSLHSKLRSQTTPFGPIFLFFSLYRERERERERLRIFMTDLFYMYINYFLKPIERFFFFLFALQKSIWLRREKKIQLIFTCKQKKNDISNYLKRMKNMM